LRSRICFLCICFALLLPADGHVAAGFVDLYIPQSAGRREDCDGQGGCAHPMIAALIFVVSILTFLQFFVSYSRSLIAESQTQELSDETREICKITARNPAGDQFQRFLQLIAVCPESGEDSGKVFVVKAYYRLLVLVHAVSRWALPGSSAWIESERSGCAYAVAVVLDRRIAHNRRMMATQTSH